jgi:SAM-dependent methyltransferase
MSATVVRVSPDWLAVREAADAAARVPDLVEEARRRLPDDRPLRIYDLGSGTGSMTRWLAPRLGGRQHWVLCDWDADLLDRAGAAPPDPLPDGVVVTVETRHCDVSRLGPDDLAGASLVTSSALLDLMTAEELSGFVAACANARCPVLVSLSVTGDVRLVPADPLDEQLRDAFNAHQRRTVGGRRLLGPDAVDAAVEAFADLGAEVLVRPSPWRLGAQEAALAQEWLSGWTSAACELRPELSAAAAPYLERRLAEAAAGRLEVTVQHHDVLVLPR